MSGSRTFRGASVSHTGPQPAIVANKLTFSAFRLTGPPGARDPWPPHDASRHPPERHRFRGSPTRAHEHRPKRAGKRRLRRVRTLRAKQRVHLLRRLEIADSMSLLREVRELHGIVPLPRVSLVSRLQALRGQRTMLRERISRSLRGL